MIQINLYSILYISFRLAPFILVSFFSISSILNQDFKGLIYLCGLLLTSFLAIVTGNTLKNYLNAIDYPEDDLYNNVTKTCHLLTLSDNGPISNIPLSLIVFSYTFAYLGTIIFKYNLVNQNIPVFIIFSALILADGYWILSNDCFKPLSLFAALCIGVGSGIAWAYFIDSLKVTKLQYFNGLSNKEFCSVPSKQTFKCKASVTGTEK
jgi:hypothetical protein